MDGLGAKLLNLVEELFFFTLSVVEHEHLLLVELDLVSLDFVVEEHVLLFKHANYRTVFLFSKHVHGRN